MPYYLFKHPKKNKVVEVFFHMNDDKIYIDDGVQWERVYTIPNGLVIEKFDPNNPQDFVHKTRHSKGSLGDLIDRSEELSNKRISNSATGRDPVKDKFFDKWSKKRHGRKHPEDNR